jgi:ribosomal protein S18 acetylase RimI-like enzyme
MEIRQARADDVPVVVALHGQLQEHLATRNPRFWQPERNDAAMYQDLIRDESGALFVAEEAGRIVALLGGRIVLRDAERPGVVGFVDTAYVRADCRRRGVGRSLMRRLLAFFEERGAQDVCVRYVLGNHEGERFWRGLGFEPFSVSANATPKCLRARLQELNHGPR